MKKRLLWLLITIVLSLLALIFLSSCEDLVKYGGKVVEDEDQDWFTDEDTTEHQPTGWIGSIEEFGDWKARKIISVDETYNKYEAYEVVEYIGSSGELIIPAQFEGVPIGYIDYKAFLNTSFLGNAFETITSQLEDSQSFKMDDLLEYYDTGDGLLHGCKFFENIYYEGDISSWCDIVFERINPINWCENFYVNNELVTEITIPNGVKKIGSYAFYGWKGTKVVIPGSVKSLGEDAFLKCENLTSVTLNEGTTTIGKECFSKCKNLAEINFPRSVTTIERYAFNGCGKLKSIELTGKIRKIEGGTFSGCSDLESIVVPNTLRAIECNAFFGCSSLESIVLPDEMIKISSGAFCGCKKLEEMTIGSKVDYIGKNAFAGCENLKSIAFADPNGWLATNTVIIDNDSDNWWNSNRNIKYDSDRRWWNGKTADVTDPTKNAQEMLTQGMCLYRDKE